MNRGETDMSDSKEPWKRPSRTRVSIEWDDGECRSTFDLTMDGGGQDNLGMNVLDALEAVTGDGVDVLIDALSHAHDTGKLDIIPKLKEFLAEIEK